MHAHTVAVLLCGPNIAPDTGSRAPGPHALTPAPGSPVGKRLAKDRPPTGVPIPDVSDDVKEAWQENRAADSVLSNQGLAGKDFIRRRLINRN